MRRQLRELPLVAPVLGIVVVAAALVIAGGDARVDCETLEAPEPAGTGSHHCEYLAWFARSTPAEAAAAWTALFEERQCPGEIALPERRADESQVSWLMRIAGTEKDFIAPDECAILREAGDAGIEAVLRVFATLDGHGHARGKLPYGFEDALLRDDVVARIVFERLASPDPVAQLEGLALAGHVRPASPHARGVLRAVKPILGKFEVAAGVGCGYLGDPRERSRLESLVAQHAWTGKATQGTGVLGRLAEDDDLLALLVHDDEAIALAALQVLHWRPCLATRDAVARAAGDPRLTRPALAMLRNWSAVRDVRDVLAGHLPKLDLEPRRQVAEALATIGDPRGVDALILALPSDGEAVRSVESALQGILGERVTDEPWASWWASRRESFDLGLHHAARVAELADDDLGVTPAPAFSADVIAHACTEACIPILERAAATASPLGQQHVEAFLAAHADRWRAGGASQVVAAGEEMRRQLREGVFDEVPDHGVPPSLVRAALLRVAGAGWEAENLLVDAKEHVDCEMIRIFEESLEEEDFEDLGSSYLELREAIRCD